MTRWAVLTGEYPPQPGGVSDYTRQVAEGLAAAGDDVAVYASSYALEPDPAPNGVRIRRLPDRFGLGGLRWLDGELSRHRPDRILIQYVPHAFGLKAMNLPFAAWVATRARQVAPVWVMFHEVVFPFVRRPLRHNLVAVVNRVMARTIAGAADRVLVSIPEWGRLVNQICPRARPAEWLPVPCNVATNACAAATAIARSRYAPDPAALLVGHFGTFGRLITDLLEPAVVKLLRSEPRVRVVFIGRGAERFQAALATMHPELAGRAAATGELSPAEVAAHLRACDILLQPYPDGISSRRTSVMAGLANGVPVVTNLGALSEPLWAGAPGVTIVAGPDPAALSGSVLGVLSLARDDRIALGALGAELYESRFTLDRTIAGLRETRPKAACLTTSTYNGTQQGEPQAAPYFSDPTNRRRVS